MYDYGYDENAAMNIRDSVSGIVRYQDYNGNLHIDLNLYKEKEKQENISAFGYWTGRVSPGTKVICSVRRFAKDDRDLQVNVDSVEYDDERAA